MGIPGAIDDIRPFAALAQNATTIVYKAYQSSLERFVLLKRLRMEYSRDEDLAARFQDEARIVARVQHPNIVAIHAFGSDASGAYIVAEFVEGFSLRELIDRAKIVPDIAVYILLESARGLRAAHEKEVLHRDLKPSNILISHDGDVKLADFGLASVSESAESACTEVRGTLPYLAPEQILGNPADRRSDLFSLGATFFEMLTGRRAFAGTDSKEIFDSVLNHHPIKYLPATPGVTPEIKRVCATLLERDPDKRFSDAGELIDALESYRGSRGARITQEDLKRYLEDPSAFAVAAATRREAAPNVTIVPDRRPAQPAAHRTKGLLRRGIMGTAMFLFVALSAYIGSQLLKNNYLAEASVSSALKTRTFVATLPPDSVLALSESIVLDIADYTKEEQRVDLAVPEPLTDQELEADQRADTRDDLASDSSAEKGLLEITVDPGAGVFVDLDSIGTSTLSYPLVVEMRPGVHQITLSNPKFPKWTSDVEIEQGSRTPIKVSLWSLVGRLEIKVSPWAEVFIDDRYIGQTPLSEPIILLPGAHDLRLVNPELDIQHSTTVAIEQGQIVERSFILDELD